MINVSIHRNIYQNTMIHEYVRKNSAKTAFCDLQQPLRSFFIHEIFCVFVMLAFINCFDKIRMYLIKKDV